METFKYVLYLFACASKGEKIEIVKDIDIKDIYTISMKHGIWSIVFISIKEIYNSTKNAFNLNSEMFEKLDSGFMQYVYNNIRKWQSLPEIIKKMQDAQINVCLLKGITLGALYSEPYARVSSDIDLLIEPDAEKRAYEILENEGFNILYKWEGSHHTKCVRNDIGLLELHTQLYDKEVQELWFETDTAKNYILTDFEYDNLFCKQLNSTDGLIFNFLHFVKHYISGLITVKQLMDVMLYIKNYKESIDFDKFDSVISNLSYFRLYKTFKCIAVQYLNFSLKDLQEDNSLFSYSDYAEAVLEDMNKYAATENASIYYTYSKNLLYKKQKIHPRKIKPLFERVWADKKRMKELYGKSYENIFFRPLLQLHRIFVRLVNIKKYIFKRKITEKKETTEAADRIGLFEKIGVL